MQNELFLLQDAVKNFKQVARIIESMILAAGRRDAAITWVVQSTDNLYTVGEVTGRACVNFNNKLPHVFKNQSEAFNVAAKFIVNDNAGVKIHWKVVELLPWLKQQKLKIQDIIITFERAASELQISNEVTAFQLN